MRGIGETYSERVLIQEVTKVQLYLLTLLLFSLVTWSSLEILRYTPRILDHLTPAERLYAYHVMSQPFKVPVNSTDALECFTKISKARKKHQGQGSSRPVLEGQGYGPLPQAHRGVGDVHQQKHGHLDAMASSLRMTQFHSPFPLVPQCYLTQVRSLIKLIAYCSLRMPADSKRWVLLPPAITASERPIR